MLIELHQCNSEMLYELYDWVQIANGTDDYRIFFLTNGTGTASDQFVELASPDNKDLNGSIFCAYDRSHFEALCLLSIFRFPLFNYLKTVNITAHR